MTEHPHRLAREAGNAGSVRLRHPLEQLDASRVARSLSIYRPDDATIEWLCELARRNLPQSAPADIVKRVVAQNPDAIWAIARKAASGDAPFPAEGFIATLPISQLGLSQLVANTFNGADPEPAAIAAAREKPAAIYIWAAYAPGRLIAAVPLVFEQLSTPLYQDADLIARAATPEGRRLSEVLGLKRAHSSTAYASIISTCLSAPTRPRVARPRMTRIGLDWDRERSLSPWREPTMISLVPCAFARPSIWRSKIARMTKSSTETISRQRT